MTKERAVQLLSKVNVWYRFCESEFTDGITHEKLDPDGAGIKLQMECCNELGLNIEESEGNIISIVKYLTNISGKTIEEFKHPKLTK